MTEQQEELEDFQKSRNQLLGVSSQKQQLEMQSNILKTALEELEKTSEKKVYKAVGNVLILSDTKKVLNDLKETKESVDLRLKSLKKQEDTIVDKLNKLKSKIESSQKEAKK